MFDVVHPGHIRHLLYAKSKADILVASITADSNNVKHVDWSHATNSAACPAKASTYTGVPAGLIAANQSVIMSTVSYTYTGSLNMVIQTVPTFVKTFYNRPRKVTTISCPTC